MVTGKIEPRIMTTETNKFPAMFEMASKECTVVMAIWADSESMYIDTATETLQIPARHRGTGGEGSLQHAEKAGIAKFAASKGKCSQYCAIFKQEVQ